MGSRCQKDVIKIQALEAVYSFYELSFRKLSSGCEPGCNHCCTVNVVATSLEIDLMLRGHNEKGIDLTLLARYFKKNGGIKLNRYRPLYTINHTASAYLEGKSLPIDKGKHAPGVCPLLAEDGLCLIYDCRPFSCRAMSSQVRCDASGKADMLPFLVAVNFVIYQIIEHLDQTGTTGNMLDFLQERQTGDRAGRFLENRSLADFAIDPGFYKPITAFLKKLMRQPVDDQVLADFLPTLVVSGRP